MCSKFATGFSLVESAAGLLTWLNLQAQFVGQSNVGRGGFSMDGIWRQQHLFLVEFVGKISISRIRILDESHWIESGCNRMYSIISFVCSKQLIGVSFAGGFSLFLIRL